MGDYIKTISTAISDPLDGETIKKEIDKVSIMAAEAIKRANGFRVVTFDDLPISVTSATWPLLFEFMPEQAILVQVLQNTSCPICPGKYGVLIVIKLQHNTIPMPAMFFHEEDNTYFCSYNQYSYNLNGTIPTWQRVNPGQYNGRKFAKNEDLNATTDCGFYYCDEGTISNTLSNKPASTSLFVLEVRNGPGKVSGPTDTNTRRQQIFTDYNNGDIYVRFNTSYNSYSWGAWKKVTMT